MKEGLADYIGKKNYPLHVCLLHIQETRAGRRKKGNMGSLGNSGNAMCPFEKEANAHFLSKLSLLQTSTRPYSQGGLARVTLL